MIKITKDKDNAYIIEASTNLNKYQVIIEKFDGKWVAEATLLDSNGDITRYSPRDYLADIADEIIQDLNIILK
jgi:hypothetical protein